MFSGDYSNQLHAAGIPSLLVSLVTQLAADNTDCIQVQQLFIIKLCNFCGKACTIQGMILLD